MPRRLASPALAPALAALLILCGADGAVARDLDFYFIDVMGGAATLIVTPENESILIDSGWPGQEDRDPKRIEHVLKDVAGLAHLGHLVTTHWHTDHYGGVEGLAKRVRIDHFWDRGLPDEDAPELDKAAFPDGPKPEEPIAIAYRRVSRGKRKALKPGDRFPLKGKVETLVLASGGEVIGGSAIATPPDQANAACQQAPPDLAPDPSDNARSLALEVRLGSFTFLDCGDLTWNVEKRLACPVDRVGPVDLFQVTHHGLDVSNHPTLLQTIAPTVAIMDNGPTKGCSPETVRRLRSLPSLLALYQLHKNATTGPGENTEPARIANTDPAGGQFLRASVSPDGTRFRVQIGTDGPSQLFRTR